MPRYSDELLPAQSAWNNNRLLMDDSEMADDRDPFIRPGVRESPMLGSGMPRQRQLSPLIEEEDVSAPQAAGSQADAAWSLGMPKLVQMKQHKDARRIYDAMMYNKASANPWTRIGQQTQSNVSEAFGERSARIPGFEKLFGAPASNYRSRDRAMRRAVELDVTGRIVTKTNDEGKEYQEQEKAPGIRGAFKRFRWRMTNRFRGTDGLGGRVGTREQVIGPKMSWMQRLFGARPKRRLETAKAMGLSSTRAPMGQSSGWADQLADLADRGGLGDGAENFAKSSQAQGHPEAPPNEDEHYAPYRYSSYSDQVKEPEYQHLSGPQRQEAPAFKSIDIGEFENQMMPAAEHQSEDLDAAYGQQQLQAYMNNDNDADDDDENEKASEHQSGALNNNETWQNFMANHLRDLTS